MTYDYTCPACSAQDTRTVPVAEMNNQKCKCGATLKNTTKPTVNICIPDWFHDGPGTAALPQNDYERGVWEENGVTQVKG
jgi:hypothetical protein